LWWGHRIPAYFCFKKGEKVEKNTTNDNWVAARNKEEAMEKAMKMLNLPSEEI
jgi:valyl-tRNA synthetase